MHRIVPARLLLIIILLLGSGIAFSQASYPALSKQLEYTNGHCPLEPINSLRIGNTDGPAIRIKGCKGVVIENCVFALSPDEAIFLDLCDNILIKNCVFADVGGGVYAAHSTRIRIDGNQFSNVSRRPGGSRGQFVQFDQITGDSNAIINNAGENIAGHSAPEDLVNLFKSSGTSNSPLMVQNNSFRGGGPSEHGGGILAGDKGGEEIVISNNTLVNPGQFGLAVAGGNDIHVTNNHVFSRNLPFSNVGIYVYNFGPGECGVVEVTGNFVNWTDRNGTQKLYYNSGNCGLIVGNASNDFNSSIGADVLSPEIISTDRVLDLELNNDLQDQTGITKNISHHHVSFANEGIENCAAFTGSDSYLSLPSSAWWKPPSQKISVSLWAKPDKWGGIQGMMRSADADGFSDGWRMNLQDSVFKPMLTTTGGSRELSCEGLVPNRWNLLVFTYDGNKFTGYVNGVAKASVQLSGDIVYNHDCNMVIGYTNGNGYWYTGKLDEIKIDRGVLTGDDVSQAFVQDKARFDGLIAHYPLDGDLNDYSGNGFDGHSDLINFSTDGRIAGSALFAAQTKFGVSSSPLLKPDGGQITVAAWIKPDKLNKDAGLAHAPDARGWGDGWRLALVNGLLSVHLVSTGGQADIYAPGMIDGEWNHIAFSYDGQQVRLYLNGSAVGTFPLHGGIDYEHHGDMEFGYCEGLPLYAGGMDEIRMYRTALDSLTIAGLAHARSDRTESFGAQVSVLSAGGTPEWKVFPNPGSGPVYFTISALSDDEDNGVVSVYNLEGKRIWTKTMDIRSGGKYLLDAERLAGGIYIVECKTKRHRMLQKLVISR